MMRRLASATVLAAALLTAALAGAISPARAHLRVVATTADMAALAAAVAGGSASVVSIVPAGADAEAYGPRPGDVEKLQRSDVVVRVGLGYDYWLDRLLVQAANAEVMRGGDGYVDASAGIPLLDVRSASAANDSGHSHGTANPHYWLDPHNAVTITGGIAEALIRRMPAERESIIGARQRFVAALDEHMAAWTARAASFAGVKVIAYHDSWPYFARRFRLDIAGVIEPRPGVAPSPAHLARLIADGRSGPVRAVVHEPAEPTDASRFVAERLGVPVVVLASSVGSLPGADDYFALFDTNIAALASALGGRAK
jgi:ABC-type Zn uptake system ZnuABC Zn-binding protein ZnuA